VLSNVSFFLADLIQGPTLGLLGSGDGVGDDAYRKRRRRQTLFTLSRSEDDDGRLKHSLGRDFSLGLLRRRVVSVLSLSLFRPSGRRFAAGQQGPARASKGQQWASKGQQGPARVRERPARAKDGQHRPARPRRGQGKRALSGGPIVAYLVKRESAHTL